MTILDLGCKTVARKSPARRGPGSEDAEPSPDAKSNQCLAKALGTDDFAAECSGEDQNTEGEHRLDRAETLHIKQIHLRVETHEFSHVL